LILNSDTENDTRKAIRYQKIKKKVPEAVNLRTYNTMDTRKGQNQTWSTKQKS